MKLFVAPIAPNPTKVRLYVAEKLAGGAQFELTEVWMNLVKGQQSTQDHLGRNPFAQVPVLEFGDGTFLSESLAIIEYLEECQPEPPMIGREPLERARVRELERIVELRVLQPVARIVHATRSPLAYAPNPEIVSFFRPALDKALAILDRELSDGRAFVAGDTCSIADCTLQAACQFARFGKLDVCTPFENLSRWNEGYRRRDSVKSILNC